MGGDMDLGAARHAWAFVGRGFANAPPQPAEPLPRAGSGLREPMHGASPAYSCVIHLRGSSRLHYSRSCCPLPIPCHLNHQKYFAVCSS